MDRTGYRGAAYQYYVILVQPMYDDWKWSWSAGNNGSDRIAGWICRRLFLNSTIPVELHDLIAGELSHRVRCIYFRSVKVEEIALLYKCSRSISFFLDRKVRSAYNHFMTLKL